MITLELKHKAGRNNWYDRISPIGTFDWLIDRNKPYKRWEVLEDEEPEQTPVDYGVNSLLSHFSVADRAQLEAYLTSYTFLVPVLEEARGTLTSYYPDASYRLEIERDEDDAAELHLVIETKEDANVAFQKLHRFQMEWWILSLDRAQGKLHIYLELI